LVMYIIGTPGTCNKETQFISHAFRSNIKAMTSTQMINCFTFRILLFKSRSHVATMKHLFCSQEKGLFK
jgi:hypothetical protein